MSPLERYLRHLDRPQFHPDPAQEAAVRAADRVYRELQRPTAAAAAGWFAKRRTAPHSVTGLYLWGDVGRGKTFIMDLLAESLPHAARRVHFQSLMRGVHLRLQQLPRSPDPLPLVGRELAVQARLWCIDEFHVDDVGDAMLLAGIVSAVLDNGAALVVTSNIALHDLYRNGMQRERFMPAIRLLERHTQQVCLNGELDYRGLRSLSSDALFVGERSEGEAFIGRRFGSILAAPDQVLQINGRNILCKASAGGAAWFDFAELCDGPRSALDYLEIGDRYRAICISHIHVMDEECNDVVRRFIDLIDALYDRRISLVVSAQAPLDNLYTGRMLAFPFRRTVSRLREMLSTGFAGGMGGCP